MQIKCPPCIVYIRIILITNQNLKYMIFDCIECLPMYRENMQTPDQVTTCIFPAIVSVHRVWICSQCTPAAQSKVRVPVLCCCSGALMCYPGIQWSVLSRMYHVSHLESKSALYFHIEMLFSQKYNIFLKLC